MLILLYGSDTFRAREKLEELKRRFLERNNGNLFLISSIDADNFNIAEFRNKVLSSGFFAEKKMIVWKRQETRDKGQGDDILEIIKKIPEETVLVIWEKSEDEKFLKSELGKYLLNTPDTNHVGVGARKYIFEFNLLQGTELANWIKERAAGYGCKIDSDAIADICDILGNDLQKVDLELNKICAYAQFFCHSRAIPAGRQESGNPAADEIPHQVRDDNVMVRDDNVMVRDDGGVAVQDDKKRIAHITRKMIREMLSKEAEDNIFKFLDALATKNKRLAFLLLKEEFDAGVPELQILGSLSRQARIMLWTKEVLQKNPNINQAGLAKELDIHPYAAGKALVQAKNFDASELKNLFRRLLQIDMAIKTGGAPARVLFDRMIAKI